MAPGVSREVDTVIVGNGPSALILSYLLHGHIPFYDDQSPHPDHILDEKLRRRDHDLLDVDIDAVTDHFAASRFSYSTQALPVNVLLDTLVRPLGETDDADKKTCITWKYEPSRAVSHVVLGNSTRAGGQWVHNPVSASGHIGTLSYAGMLSLPGYSFDDHFLNRTGRPMPVYLRPSRHAVADYLATYPEKVGIADAIQNGEQVAGVCRRSDGDGFYVASHGLVCKHLVLATGIFSKVVLPPPSLRSLAPLQDYTAVAADPILVIGSGFSAADVIVSTPPRQRIIHVFKWAPDTAPSPLRACHQQAYPEYAGVYRRMKLASLATPPKEKRPRRRSTIAYLDQMRDWHATYEGLANADVVRVESTDDGAVLVTFHTQSAAPVQRRVSRLAYVAGRRGSLAYLCPDLLQDVLPAGSTVDSDMISGQTLREKANVDLEVAPGVFVVGSLTGDSLIRFAYGGCAYAAGKIMGLSHGPPHTYDMEQGVHRRGLLKQSASRCQTPAASPSIPAMNGLDGHEASPLSLGERSTVMPLDKRKMVNGSR